MVRESNNRERTIIELFPLKCQMMRLGEDKRKLTDNGNNNKTK